MSKLRAAFREFLEETYQYYVQFLKEQGWLNPETGGPWIEKIAPLLQPYLGQETRIREENLELVLLYSAKAGITAELLGHLSAAMDWYCIGQYQYYYSKPALTFGYRTANGILVPDLPHPMHREACGRSQLESAICATRVGNHERARQLYEWAAWNYGFSEREIQVLEGGEDKTHIVLWTNFSYRAYALLCLGRWAEALSTAEQGEAYFRRDRHWKDKTYTPIVLYPIVQAVARYKLDPSPENRRKAIEMLSPQAVASRNHVGHLWALFYLYNLRALHPDLAEEGSTARRERQGWERKPAVETTFAVPGAVTALAFSPDGRMLAVALEGEIYLWHWERGQIRRTWVAHPNYIRSLAFSPDGRLLASGANRAYQTQEPVLRLWELPEGRMRADFVGHTDAVTGLVFAPDGERLFSVSEDGTVRCWAVASGASLWRAEVGAGEMLHALALSPDGRWLAGAGGGFHGRVYLWGTDGQLQRWLEAHPEQVCLGEEEIAEHTFWSVAFDGAGEHLVVGSMDGNLLVFRWRGRRRPVEIAEAHEPGVVRVVVPPEGKVVISAGMESVVRGWDWERGELLWEMEVAGEVSGLALTQDGRWLAVGTRAGTVYVVGRP